jgi:hypothetical protein
MKLKDGDRYLCKKSKYVTHHNQKIFVEKGKYYTISSIRYFWLTIKIGNFDMTFDMFCDGSWYFNDYFYTKQEERAIKIKKLNDVK